MTVAAEAPAKGAYLTDGKRLVEVIGVDRDGNFHLEDCAADIGDEGTSAIKVTHDELLRDWRAVSRNGSSESSD